MNLLVRFSILFCVLTIGVGSVFWLSYSNSTQAAAVAMREVTRERQQRLQSAIVLRGRGLESLVSSYAWWNEMVKFMEKPDPAWASKTVDNMVGSPAGGEAIWIVDPEFKLVHAINDAFARPSLPFASPDEMRTVTKTRYTFSYFTLIDGRLWQIFGAAIQSADAWRHETPVHGYLLLGKQWDDRWISQLDTIASARITLNPVGYAAPANSARISLKGLDGRALVELDAQFVLNPEEDSRREFLFQLGLASGATIIAFGCIALVLALTVLRPLSQITRSLESRLPTPLAKLVNSRTEFGEIARLVAGQLRWGRMLEDEMHRQLERSNPESARREVVSNETLRLRLSGDIHDGPIQSIYAAGLQLAAVQAAAEQGVAPRPEQIAAINGMLQQASSDLRNLILDLEPEELREHDLETALQRLERRMQQGGRCRFELEIADNALDGLTRAAQTELYFICRELASNSLRHSHADVASLRFSLSGGFLRLVWHNNGVTPRTDALTTGGHGTRNVERRVAALGGTSQNGPDGADSWRATCEIPLTSLTVAAPTLKA